MRVEITVPAHNEGPIIYDAVTRIKNALAAYPEPVAITVISNGSTDDTERRARDAGVSVQSITTAGKGAAVIYAAQHSSADVFGFIDADLSADPADIPKMLMLIANKECDIAIGSRLIETDLVQRSYLRTISSRLFNMTRRMLLGIKVRDTQCGLKVMNERGRQIMAACQETGWFFDMEFLTRAERAGLRIHEVSVRWDEHRFLDRKSKLRLVRDGFGAIAAMVRIRARLMSQ